VTLVGCKAAILQRLREAGKPLASFEFNEAGNIGYSENSIASRLPEMALLGLIVGRFRVGKPFKEWSIVNPGQQELPL